MLSRAAALVLAAAAVVVVVIAPPPAAAAPLPVEAALAQMESADPGLETYRASVEFRIGLRSFPYLQRTVHGDAFFKRPSRLEVVFNDLPGFAERFRNVYVGLGSAGRPTSALILRPKNHDRRLRQVEVVLDPASSLPARMVWSYRDGRIEMTQEIADVNGHAVVRAQNADIRMPGVHAVVAAKIANYVLNAPIDEAVFTKPTR